MATSQEMRALHPDQLKVLRVRGLVMAAAFAIAVGVLDWIAIAKRLPLGAATLAAIVGGGLAAWLMAKRRYRAWRYRMDEDELHIASGLWVRSKTVVPFGRVQHIDVVQGPLQRGFGIGSLVLHTAGTRGAAILLPGLAAEEAERMRDHIRARIREDIG